MIFFQMAKQQVLKDDELIEEFKKMVTVLHKSRVEDKTSHRLFKDIVQRVVNTMANSFFASQDMLERIANKKGIDAQMSLRDKLKAYASGTRTKLQL